MVLFLDYCLEIVFVGVKQGMHLRQLHAFLEPINLLMQCLVERVIKEKLIFIVPIIDTASFPFLQYPYFFRKSLQLLWHLSIRTNNVLQIWVFLQKRK